MATQNRPYIFEMAKQIVDVTARGEDPSKSREAALHNGIDPGELERAVVIVQHFISSGSDVEQWLHQEYIIDGWLRGYLPLETSASETGIWTLGQMADAFYATHTSQPPTHKSAPTDDGRSAISQIEARTRAIGVRVQEVLSGPEEQRYELLLAADRALADLHNELLNITGNFLGESGRDLTEYGDRVAQQIQVLVDVVFANADSAAPTAAQQDGS